MVGPGLGWVWLGPADWLADWLGLADLAGLDPQILKIKKIRKSENNAKQKSNGFEDSWIFLF